MRNCNETSADATKFSGVVQQHIFATLVKELGGGYASTLGIDLTSAQSDEVFKWFLASILLGNRVGEGVAIATYKEFEKACLLSPERVSATGWQSLVDTLDRGGYVMYNFRTAMGLLEATWTLNKKYEGDLNRLHFFARDERDLEKRLRTLGNGIKPATVKLFLRELRELWEKAEPPLAKPSLLASRNLGLTQAIGATSPLEELRIKWETNREDQVRFSDFETALTRLGQRYCRKQRCARCPLRAECQNAN